MHWSFLNARIRVLFVSGRGLRLINVTRNSLDSGHRFDDLPLLGGLCGRRDVYGHGGRNAEHGRGLGLRQPGENFLVERGRGFLLALTRQLAALVRVLRVARRAPRLFDVLFNHRDDSVVGHASLARTVIVQYVTETQPALLH
jgi:hypothetical protein